MGTVGKRAKNLFLRSEVDAVKAPSSSRPGHWTSPTNSATNSQKISSESGKFTLSFVRAVGRSLLLLLLVRGSPFASSSFRGRKETHRSRIRRERGREGGQLALVPGTKLADWWELRQRAGTNWAMRATSTSPQHDLIHSIRDWSNQCSVRGTYAYVPRARQKRVECKIESDQITSALENRRTNFDKHAWSKSEIWDTPNCERVIHQILKSSHGSNSRDAK